MIERLISIFNKLTIRNFRRAFGMFWDWVRGYDFTRTVHSEDMGYDPDVVHRSESFGGYWLVDFFAKMNISQDDAIIDVGCGKGSSMRSMTKFPFTRIDGVEIFEKLVEVARKNFAKMGEERCHVFSGSATDLDRYHDYNMFYFFSPFPDQTMAEVIAKIDASVKTLDREAIVIYVNPECHFTLMENSNFKLLCSTRIDGEKTHIYSNWPMEKSRLSKLSLY